MTMVEVKQTILNHFNMSIVNEYEVDLHYRLPIFISATTAHYRSCKIFVDDDVEALFLMATEQTTKVHVEIMTFITKIHQSATSSEVYYDLANNFNHYSKLFFATTHQNLIPPQMAPKMFACIYDNGDMIPNPENGVLFKSNTCIMVQLHRGFTFSQLIEIILQRAKKDPTNPPPVLHFRFPTQICGRHVTYTYETSMKLNHDTGVRLEQNTIF
ncbi:unnamed protein product [Sphenostylis stenocarpa]|uniref:Uncharacterized protein n=1 Tax=Sphenostylis stenocarpa TaxID=92480 RepID=A0AA87B8T5_9FABA|nr:unnamed protein product [Sphenostylis stenocarpa]